MTANRNFGLDLIRAVSIIFVLIAHRFTLKVELGILGVQIFFVLSGFLIGQILLKNFSHEPNIKTVMNFWKRRWFRTLPLYYLVLSLKLLIYGNPYGWKIVVYFLFLQANFVGIEYFGVSWSLVVEEWFYLFLPVATLFFFPFTINPSRFNLFLFGFIVFFFLARFFWNYFQKGIIIYQFDCLLIGVLLANLKLNFNKEYSFLNRFMFPLLSILAGITLLFSLGAIKDAPLYDTYSRVVWHLLVSLFIALGIPWFEQSDFVNRTLKSYKAFFYLVTWTSILTYAMYLFHMDVFRLVLFKSDSANLIVHTIILFALSGFIYTIYEHPMMSLRDGCSIRQYFKSIHFFSYRKTKV